MLTDKELILASIFKDPGAWFGDTFLGEGSTRDAVASQERGAERAADVTKEMFDTQREDFAPWREKGLGALEEIDANQFMNNWQQDPGYKFRMDEGLKAVNRGASSRGASQGGAAMKALSRYGQGLASQEYQNVYNRKYGRLSDLAGLGMGATQGQAGAASRYGQNMSNVYMGLSNAQAAAQMAQANRRAGMAGSLIGVGAAYLGAQGSK